MPFVSPDTTIGVTIPLFDTEPVVPPLEDMHVALYAVIGFPPSLPGALNVTVIGALPALVVGAAGASGGDAHAADALRAGVRSATSVAMTARRSVRFRLRLTPT